MDDPSPSAGAREAAPEELRNVTLEIRPRDSSERASGDAGARGPIISHSDSSNGGVAGHRRAVGITLMASVVLMGAATFGVLGGGQAGYLASRGLLQHTGCLCGIIAVMVEDAYEADHAPNVKLLCETAAKWIALVIPRSVIEIGLYRAFEPDRAGTMWQMEAQLWQVAWYFMAICVWGRWLFRSHLDRRPTIWRWWVIAFGSLYLAQFGACSPFPLISMIGKGMYMLTCTVGLFYAVAHLDKNAEQADVKNGYVMLTCISSWVIVWFSLQITSMKLGGALVTSFVQMSYQMAVLKVLVPASKRCFGDDHRKLWSFKFPAMLLALEQVGNTRSCT
jgi:hypothetical protein